MDTALPEPVLLRSTLLRTMAVMAEATKSVVKVIRIAAKPVVIVVALTATILSPEFRQGFSAGRRTAAENVFVSYFHASPSAIMRTRRKESSNTLGGPIS